MAVFVIMGARELLPFFDGLIGSLEVHCDSKKKKHRIALYLDRKHSENASFSEYFCEPKMTACPRMCSRHCFALQARLGGCSTLYVMALYPVWIAVSVICAPFFILYVAARNVYYKVCAAKEPIMSDSVSLPSSNPEIQFRHRRATKRNLFRRQLQKSEYLWGITKTAEAGLESCGQLILQVLSMEYGRPANRAGRSRD